MADTKEDTKVGENGGMGSSAPHVGLLAHAQLQVASTEEALGRPATNNPFAANTSSVFGSTKSVLRPSQLKAPFSSNPFARINENNPSDNPFAPASSSTSDSSPGDAKLSEAGSSEDNNSVTASAPKFVPLHSSRDSISFAGGTVPGGSPSGLARASGFVFGQNLQDRVAKQPDQDGGEGTSSMSSSVEHHATNGTSDLLFSAAMQATSDSQSTTNKEDAGTLAQSAEAWERARDAPAPPTHHPGPILTGEEEETNVIQINCRLFAFEGGIWRERGRGHLRLNDGNGCSRLVCRAAGSLRVLLNTKVWADMAVERAGSKSLRVTATDSAQQVKVFLIMASPEEVNQLHKSLSRRVAQAKKTDESCGSRDNATESYGEVSATEAISEECKPGSPNILTASDKSDIADIEEGDPENPTEREDMIVSQSLGNPVVIISEEDDTSTMSRGVLKRPLSDQDASDAKKLCTKPSSEDVPQL